MYPDYNRYLRARSIPVHYPEKHPAESLCAGFSKIPGPDFVEVLHGNLVTSDLENLARNKNPFLIFTSFEAPHSPWTLPEEFRHFYHPEKVKLPQVPEYDKFNKPDYRVRYHEKRSQAAPADDKLIHAIAIYHALTSIVDEQIGRIVETLERTGLDENTCIIFMSDHGDHLGNHRAMGKCLSVEEDLIHVPLILYSPAVFKSRISNTLAESIDIFPTIMELAGIKAPAGLQGASLLPHALGQKNAPERKTAFCEEKNGTWPGHICAKNRDFKLIINENGFEELYKISEDPHEWKNLAAQTEYNESKRELKDELLRFHFKNIDQAKIREVDFVTRFMEPGYFRY